jgi:hypothetical protein
MLPALLVFEVLVLGRPSSPIDLFYEGHILAFTLRLIVPRASPFLDLLSPFEKLVSSILSVRLPFLTTYHPDNLRPSVRACHPAYPPPSTLASHRPFLPLLATALRARHPPRLDPPRICLLLQALLHRPRIPHRARANWMHGPRVESAAPGIQNGVCIGSSSLLPQCCSSPTIPGARHTSHSALPLRLCCMSIFALSLYSCINLLLRRRLSSTW